MTEPTQNSLTTAVPEAKISGRKVRSMEQLAVLAKAREKALEIRKQNQQLRQKQMETIKTEKEIKVAEIENKYQEVKEKKENIIPFQPKVRCEAEQKVRSEKVKQNLIESDDSDDDLVTIRISKKKLVKYQKKAEKKEIKSEAIPVKKNPLFNQ